MELAKGPAEQRVLLRNVSWETYERLISEREERPVPRFFYDRGDIARGFEPDECFYFQSVEHIRGKEDVDLDAGDPPPDLVFKWTSRTPP